LGFWGKSVDGLLLSSLGSLGEGVVGGFLILEYQKSSLTHHTLTQLRKAVLVLGIVPYAKSCVVRLKGADDFWYASMRKPPLA